jgi:hypothetical protein
MPNLKIYADENVHAARAAELKAALPPLRDLLCRDLSVGPEACQLALVPVAGLPDQPLVNVELLILPRPDRTPERVRAVASAIRDLIAEAAGGAHAAVRISQLDPETYIALK